MIYVERTDAHNIKYKLLVLTLRLYETTCILKLYILIFYISSVAGVKEFHSIDIQMCENNLGNSTIVFSFCRCIADYIYKRRVMYIRYLCTQIRNPPGHSQISLTQVFISQTIILSQQIVIAAVSPGDSSQSRIK